LPFKDFVRPQSGLMDVKVCAVSGLLPTEYCDEGTVTLTYYEGTEPKQYCDLHQFKSEQTESTIRAITNQQNVLGGGKVDSSLGFDPSSIDALLKSLETQEQSATPQSAPLPGAAPVIIPPPTPPATTPTDSVTVPSTILD
jgi:penicillin-binding protein 1A